MMREGQERKMTGRITKIPAIARSYRKRCSRGSQWETSMGKITKIPAIVRPYGKRCSRGSQWGTSMGKIQRKINFHMEFIKER